MRDLEAFLAVDFGWTRGLRSIWSDPPDHVASLHSECADAIFNYFKRATRDTAPVNEPLGRVVAAPAGYGKTHLVGELRRRVWEAEGWFILIDLVGVKEFWRSAALSFFSSLQAVMPDGKTQHYNLVYRLASHLRIETAVQDIVARRRGNPYETVADLATLFVEKLTEIHQRDATVHRDVVTALILLVSSKNDIRDLAFYWLQGQSLDEVPEAKQYGFRGANDPIRVVEGLSWIMSLVGPTMIAIDQIDAIVSASNSRFNAAQARAIGSNAEDARLELAETQSIVDGLAQGLLDLHDKKRRAVTVISCLVETWSILAREALAPATDRYAAPIVLKTFPGAKTASDLVAARLAQSYRREGFAPEYATWPFAERAFASAIDFSPRRLLKVCEAHRQHCETLGRIQICESFIESAGDRPKPIDADAIDEEFATLARVARIAGYLDEDGEDDLRRLFDAILPLYAAHLDPPDDIDIAVQRDPEQKRPSLHGRIKFVFHAENDREQHYCFLGLVSRNSIAFQSRLRAAMTASGVDRALQFRHLYVLREGAVPGGKKTAELVKEFERANGRFVAPDETDLRVFVALKTLAEREPPQFEAWLRQRKPLFETTLFKIAGLAPPPLLAAAPAPIQVRPEPAAPPASACEALQPPAPKVDGIAVGRRVASGEPVTLAASLLPRHMAIIAGPGSGKTVLLRRLIEEAALMGFPAIVLDVNNDLSRLGEAWPKHPEGFGDADAAKALDYHRKADVVLWTPGVASGNPLSFSLLPDFAAIGEAAEERAQAVEMARATLDSYLAVARGGKAKLRQGVLADALRIFARHGGGGLDKLITLLSDLPDGASEIGDAAKLAAALADELRAAIATNPLLKSGGPAQDIGDLLTGPVGRTRVSVINLSGLASDESRQSFVNQLQMALFTWIKRNPSATPRLYALDEAQNFAPAQKTTPCKASTLSLVAQARKYGLGMIFATQLPRGLDNGIISNATTHVYGRVAAPATIDAIREMMAAKGGGGDDIGRLSRGEFYFSTDGMTRPVKIRTPLCLSFHPENPPTADEIAEKARKRRERLPVLA
jgi:hypothetical protein